MIRPAVDADTEREIPAVQSGAVLVQSLCSAGAVLCMAGEVSTSRLARYGGEMNAAKNATESPLAAQLPRIIRMIIRVNAIKCPQIA